MELGLGVSVRLVVNGVTVGVSGLGCEFGVGGLDVLVHCFCFVCLHHKVKA